MRQALGFVYLAFGGILITSAITGETIGELLTKGLTPEGRKKLHGKHVSEQLSSGAGEGEGPGVGVSGAVAPFSKGSVQAWERSDKGVDAILKPGSPLYAIGSGVVSIEHDPSGFGANYPVLHTQFGSYYYGHSVPGKPNGAKVNAGEQIGWANTRGQGNATTPGAIEFGVWPLGGPEAGAKIRSWLIALVEGTRRTVSGAFQRGPRGFETGQHLTQSGQAH